MKTLLLLFACQSLVLAQRDWYPDFLAQQQINATQNAPLDAEIERENAEERRRLRDADDRQRARDADPCRLVRLYDKDDRPKFARTDDHKKHAVYIKICPDDEDLP